MTDDIQKVREAYEAAMEEAMGYCGDGPKYGEYYRNAFVQALAKRLQPRPVPEKKIWSVSVETLANFRGEDQRSNILNAMLNQSGVANNPLNAIAADIIRERPDLVAAEWERRYRLARDEQAVRLFLADSRRGLFPELDP